MRNKELAAIFKSMAESFSALSNYYASDNESDDAKDTSEKTQKDEYVSDSDETNETSSDDVTNTDSEKNTETAENNDTKIYSDVEVRSALGHKANIDEGKYKHEVKDLVKKYSSDGKFGSIPKEKYSELMKELEEIGNV